MNCPWAASLPPSVVAGLRMLLTIVLAAVAAAWTVIAGEDPVADDEDRIRCLPFAAMRPIALEAKVDDESPLRAAAAVDGRLRVPRREGDGARGMTGADVGLRCAAAQVAGADVAVPAARMAAPS